MYHNERWVLKVRVFRDIFSEYITKSFAAVYLHYNNDIMFWLSAKKGPRKSAGGIKTLNIKHPVS